MLHPPWLMEQIAGLAAERRRRTPWFLRGKPWRRLRREWCQRRYHYPLRNILVISLPKSGSTWVLRMLAETPGYLAWNPPNIKWHNHDLMLRTLAPPPAGYTVTKTHTPPTEANLAVVRSLDRPYILTIRDLRDVCVSWSFYARNRASGPAYAHLAGATASRAMDYFIEQMLPGYRDWSLGWWRRRDPARGLLLRYEDLLADTTGGMSRAFAHLGLPADPDAVAAIVEKHSFQKATGRKPGQEDAGAFNRKGIAGDWRNHFSPAQEAAFMAVAGDAMIELGYADDRASVTPSPAP